jgi:nitrogen fixation protein NifB
MNFENHPCFNEKARHKFGRIHLPIAPKCNIQCNYCNRKYDCVNESRPGVASVVLSPKQAVHYLDKVFERQTNISVVGIAGPGDPFANPDETMETLHLVRNKYPDMLLCVSTNGLNLSGFVPELASLNTSHVTVTLNAIDPEIGSRIYSSVFYEGRIRNGIEGAKILLEHQIDAIKRLKEYGITVKINSVFVPGINDGHIIEVIKRVRELGAEIVNIIPLLPTKDTAFENLSEPKAGQIARLRLEAGKILPQMSHCARCRADAAGLINENMKDEIITLLGEASRIKHDNVDDGVAVNGRLVAVVSEDGININEHLGRADEVLIYEVNGGIPKFLGKKQIPISFGEEKWENYREALVGCKAIFVSAAGEFPIKKLFGSGIRVVVTEGIIEDVIRSYFAENRLETNENFECTGCSPVET